MKRSEINASIDRARKFFAKKGFPLPPYADWTPQQWKEAGPEHDEIRILGLGWDVTDFGSGDLARVGRTIFTLRNGARQDPRFPKQYAQKAMHMEEGQKSVIHYHRSKMEDICNQGGGNILIELWRAGADDELSQQSFEVSVSGIRRSVKGGDVVRLEPGASICLIPRTYHRFWAEEGHGAVLSVEVSSVCDDKTDNFFYESGERFPGIHEDEERRYVLCGEYFS